jgi:hypothetical protein
MPSQLQAETAAINVCYPARVLRWKYLAPNESTVDGPAIAAPAFVVDALRARVDDLRLVVDETPVLMAPADGPRAINSAHQIAVFEWAATNCSGSIFRVIEATRVGVSERELAASMSLRGDPLSLQPVVISGPDIRLGLRSPTDRIPRDGDPIVVGVGMRGGNCTRAGKLTSIADSSGSDSAVYLERLAAPYFQLIVTWWETARVGIDGAALYAECHRVARHVGVTPKPNPGHLIDLDEWLHTPIASEPGARLQSGWCYKWTSFRSAMGGLT